MIFPINGTQGSWNGGSLEPGCTANIVALMPPVTIGSITCLIEPNPVRGNARSGAIEAPRNRRKTSSRIDGTAAQSTTAAAQVGRITRSKAFLCRHLLGPLFSNDKSPQKGLRGLQRCFPLLEHETFRLRQPAPGVPDRHLSTLLPVTVIVLLRLCSPGIHFRGSFQLRVPSPAVIAGGLQSSVNSPSHRLGVKQDSLGGSAFRMPSPNPTFVLPSE